jgi:protein tyrosine phosphatase
MSLSVLLSDIDSHIAECQKTNGFEKEFSALLEFDNSLKRDELKHFPTALQYLHKNRWTDGGFEVYANENSRIKLPANHVFHHDYINANLIPKSVTGSHCDYIATQAPMVEWVDGTSTKEDTMNDFWNMIWLHEVPVIVMLAKLVEEEGRIKAHQYWPQVNTEKVFHSRSNENASDIKVQGIREYFYNEDEDVVIRELKVSHHGQDRTVHQIHFLGWPDNSVPAQYTEFLNVMLAADELMEGSKGPMVVHCSAGVGRTGTLICIHSIFQQLKEHHESETTEPFALNMFDTVMALKHLRWQLVYNVQQYEFCYRGILYMANKYWRRSLSNM